MDRKRIFHMEQFDIYNSRKLKNGELGVRGTPLKNGQYRYVVRVIIFNLKGDKVLIQQRQASKSSWPNFWDFTAAGGLLAGESLAEGAGRELFEETGIVYDFSETPSRMTVRFYEGWSEIFLIQRDIEINNLKLQNSEVQTAKWVSEPELLKLINTGKFIPFHYAKNIFDYLRFSGETNFGG